jgi:hypothetical protein
MSDRKSLKGIRTLAVPVFSSQKVVCSINLIVEP